MILKYVCQIKISTWKNTSLKTIYEKYFLAMKTCLVYNNYFKFLAMTACPMYNIYFKIFIIDDFFRV